MFLRSATIRRGWLLLWVALLVAAWGSYWIPPRTPLPSSGGLYWPGRWVLPVPSFAQGDPRWGDAPLGSTPGTLRAEGCAITSAAMVLASYGIDTDPGRLNRFLTRHNGFTPQGWLYWEKAAEFLPGRCEKAYEDAPSYARMDWNLLRGNPVIVRMRFPGGPTHFVVIAGKQGFDYLIRDPGAGAARGLYPLSDLTQQIEALRYYQKF
ncbi:MAG: C39 family peptidase [Verrucomicrobia bacterium]|nr:C39 family peptidase [Verrucomicrobiota bacterium]